MAASLASATLRISSDDSWVHMETVASLNANDTNTSRVEAVRKDKLAIFPDPTRGNRYLMDFMANRSLGAGDLIDTQREISRMQLVWNGKSNYRKVMMLSSFHFLQRQYNVMKSSVMLFQLCPCGAVWLFYYYLFIFIETIANYIVTFVIYN